MIKHIVIDAQEIKKAIDEGKVIRELPGGYVAIHGGKKKKRKKKK